MTIESIAPITSYGSAISPQTRFATAPTCDQTPFGPSAHSKKASSVYLDLGVSVVVELDEPIDTAASRTPRRN
jgi:hypothetical protein